MIKQGRQFSFCIHFLIAKTGIWFTCVICDSWPREKGGFTRGPFPTKNLPAPLFYFHHLIYYCWGLPSLRAHLRLSTTVSRYLFAYFYLFLAVISTFVFISLFSSRSSHTPTNDGSTSDTIQGILTFPVISLGCIKKATTTSPDTYQGCTHIRYNGEGRLILALHHYKLGRRYQARWGTGFKLHP